MYSRLDGNSQQTSCLSLSSVKDYRCEPPVVASCLLLPKASGRTVMLSALSSGYLPSSGWLQNINLPKSLRDQVFSIFGACPAV